MTEKDTLFADIGGISIAYRLHGPTDGRQVALVSGYTDQLTDWPSSLIDQLVGAGCSVLVYDMRDTGLSGQRPEWKAHNSAALMGAAMSGGPESDYTIDDLATELNSLLHVVGFAQPHIIGYSMGGIVVQHAALVRPVASLTLLFTTSNAPGLSQAGMDVLAISLAVTQPQDDTARLSSTMKLIELTNGPVHGKTHEEARAETLSAQTRAYRPDGVGRMLLCLLKSLPAHERVGQIDGPVLVIEADRDCFFGPDHADDLMARIPTAQRIKIPGSGHNLPEAVGTAVAQAWLADPRFGAGA
jgi:pimeloyl-ACP methyl ester carboxylesterase